MVSKVRRCLMGEQSRDLNSLIKGFHTTTVFVLAIICTILHTDRPMAAAGPTTTIDASRPIIRRRRGEVSMDVNNAEGTQRLGLGRIEMRWLPSTGRTDMKTSLRNVSWGLKRTNLRLGLGSENVK
ncbi:protein MraZ [Striga asiatica]|uniref:Protein MraZ n=1 Tax=Striga asiatica TaxID=4170 RepID=A0A5A7QKL4_STRAF|nr:protein MraZ [Striga asiatica]